MMIVAALVVTVCAADDSGPAPEQNEDIEPYSQSGIDAWGESFDERQSGKSDNPGCSGVLVPDQTGFGGRVSLTFDDGPVPSTTNQILDVLAERGIQATFFINGQRVNSDAARQTLARIVADGHLLANHSHNHKKLSSLDLAAVESEVDRPHSIIEEQGVAPTYFRFPFGASNCATSDLVNSFGYRVTGWHVDSADWCFASSTGGVGVCASSTFRHVPDSLRDDMGALVLEQVHRKNGGIVLFHDVHQNTADQLEGIIDELEANDFTFVNIDDVSTFPLLNSDDIGDFPFVGTVCQGDDECDFSQDAGCFNYDDGGMQAGYCVMDCEGYCNDFPGRAPTFCVSLDDGVSGSCVPQAAPENSECADLAGTAPTEVTRFVGESSAPLSTNTVCLP